MSGQPVTIREKVAACGTFLYNSKEGTVLGRSGRSWAEISLFYLIYYIALAGFFVGMLAVFYQTIDESRPKLTGSSSLLKANPGMGFQPMPDVEYTLVRFQNEKKSYMPHVESIKKIVKPYIENEAKSSPKGEPCSEDNPAPEGKSCYVNSSALLEQCNEGNDFGYAEKKPCILLRLNKIFDWMPESYNDENIKSSHASEELKTRILADPKMIYIECVGENPADLDNIGEIEYYPRQGYPFFYYPFINQPDYMSPLVFVKFMNPPKHMALMVECRALSPNIRYDKTEKEGGVHFELLVDP